MDTSNESFNPLQLIANHCYRMGQFLANAFDVLERLDPDPEFWEGAERRVGRRVPAASSAGKGAGDDLQTLAMVQAHVEPPGPYMVVTRPAGPRRHPREDRVQPPEPILLRAGDNRGSHWPDGCFPLDLRVSINVPRGAARACQARRCS